jgi:NADPH:quinone reductase-like Zn-dependent oxidoreductase
MKAYSIDAYIKPSELHTKLTDSAPEPKPKANDILCDVQYVSFHPHGTFLSDERETERLWGIDQCGRAEFLRYSPGLSHCRPMRFFCLAS